MSSLRSHDPSIPGEVLGLGVVPRLVGVPVDPVELPVGARVLVGAAHHHHVGVAHRPQLARRLLLDAVLRLETAGQSAIRSPEMHLIYIRL